MAKVKLEGVNKRFGENHVVNDFTLEIRDRQFVVLVGPSGCGKTTTLRMVAGLEDITAGEIYIGDTLVNDLAPKDRDVSMVFQNYALFPHMNVYDNLCFGLKMRKVPKNEIDQRVKEAAKLLGLSHLLDRKPRHLSGGERQRVAMGRSIVRRPQVFLFDEPLSNLDAKLRVQMRGEIKKLHGNLQSTIIYVTHDQIEAMTMADLIVVMNDGFIQQMGRPLEVYKRPRNIFVAGFIGSPAMNFLAVSLQRGLDGIFQATGDGFSLKLPEEKSKICETHQGEQLTIGIRPEHFKLGKRNGEVIEPVVEVVEPVGAEIFLILRLGPNSLTARIESTEEIRTQQKLPFSVDMTKAILFSPDGIALY